jgi:predicted nuclease of restriction endonuclease-like (RecB) superfamily
MNKSNLYSKKGDLPTQYTALKQVIGSLLEAGRQQVSKQINTILVQTYWHIGRYIVEFEQNGEDRAKYGNKLIDMLSKDLTVEYGKGFSRSNLKNFRAFYLAFPIGQTLSGELAKIQTPSGQSGKGQTLSGELKKSQTPFDKSQNVQTLSEQLSWSHYVELLKIDDALEQQFYIKQCEQENWSVRELKRQMKSMLFHRLALSKSKKEVLALANQGAQIQQTKDIIKDPYVFEFLGIPQQEKYFEGDLEDKLVANLEKFLLELGKGFAFIGRQYKISIGGRHFFVDLVFYHRILKCFVLIDLKRGEVEHQDIGQMNLYLNYFSKEENQPDDNPPIGLVLGAYKDQILMEYATEHITNQLFVSKYQLYLPNKEELKKELEKLLNNG